MKTGKKWTVFVIFPILILLSCGEFGGTIIVENKYTKSLDITVFSKENTSYRYSKKIDIPINGTGVFKVPLNGIYIVRHQKPIGSGFSDYYGYYYFSKEVSVKDGEEVIVTIDSIETKK